MFCTQSFDSNAAAMAHVRERHMSWFRDELPETQVSSQPSQTQVLREIPETQMDIVAEPQPLPTRARVAKRRIILEDNDLAPSPKAPRVAEDLVSVSSDATYVSWRPPSPDY